MSDAMNDVSDKLGRPFRAPYHPVRAYLLHKGLLGLLAFDVWVDMLEHAGRYGSRGV